MKHDIKTLQRRMELVTFGPGMLQLLHGCEVTLNGRPALLSGWRSPYASVMDKETQLTCEFAWETVELIMIERQGKFKS